MATRSRNSNFGRSGVFTCRVCERQSRETGVQSMGSELCPECYELAGIENEISDGYTTLADRKDLIDTYIARIKSKGGDASEWQQIFFPVEDQ